MPNLLRALVEGLLGREGPIALIVGILLAALGAVGLYRQRRRLTYRKVVDGKLGLVPGQDPAHPNPEVAGVLHALDQVSVVAVRFRSTGRQTIKAVNYAELIRLRFDKRYILDFRVSKPEPEGRRQELHDAIVDGATVSRRTNEHGVDPSETINREQLREDLPRALSGQLPDPDKDRRYELTVPAVELPARTSFTLLVHLRERHDRPPGEELTKDYDLDGKLSPGRMVDAYWAPKFTPIRLLSGLSLLLAGALVVVLLIQSANPFRSTQALRCAEGSTRLVGSTAFAPVTEAIARAYRDQCGAGTVTVQAKGSLEGIRDVQDAKNANEVGTISDGPAPSEAQLRGREVAVVVFALVVSRDVGLDRLSLDQVRGIYQGQYTNWRQLGSPADLPVRLVSRDARSGTREAFERHVLRDQEPALTSNSCLEPDRDPTARIIRCERGSTAEVLKEVNRIPGTLGYADAVEAAKSANVVRLRLDGQEPVIESLDRGYPFWTVEYLYTKGLPRNDSVLKQLIDYLSTDAARERIRAAGYLPCVEQSGGILDQCRAPR